MKSKILIILGTRPEIIKFFPIYKILKKNTNIKLITLFTNQHLSKDMSGVFFDTFKFKLNYKIKYKNLDLTNKYAYYISEISKYIQKINPKFTFVMGDTLSAATAAQASVILNKPILYMESGLRTGDFNQPWPEEIFRKSIAQIATYHFTPTKYNKNNLISEGVSSKNIFVTGNTVIDSIKFILKSIDKSQISKKYRNIYSLNNIVLCTIHRRENHGENLEKILNGIQNISYKYPKFNFVIPVHPNPNVKNNIKKKLSGIKNIFLINPLDYKDFIKLANKSKLLISDSGGVQEECTVLGKRVIVLRNVTERPEAINKFLYMCGPNEKKLLKIFKEIIKLKQPKPKNIFGNGNSGDIIASKINQIISQRI